MRFIFARFPVAIWNSPFLSIFLNRISTAREISRLVQYHTDAFVDKSGFPDKRYRNA